jgi:tetratricopeptide (TPR) repeat protein
MKKLLSVLALLSSFGVGAQNAYDRSKLNQWQTEGAWSEIISTAKAETAPDLPLMNAAGFAAYQTGDRASALEWFARSLAADSNSRTALYYAAVIHKSEDREAAAIPLLQRLCKNVPENAGYHQLLGDCYSETDQAPAAVDAYRRAYRLTPGSVTIASRLATALQNAKLSEQADTLLRSAMNLHPGTPLLINNAISLAYTRKQYARCATLCDSLIATTKLNYRSLLSGLYADIAQPDYRHAVKLGSVLIAMDAATEEVLYYTAIAEQKLGQYKAADTLLRQCLSKSLKPQLNEVYDALASGAEAQGEFLRSKAYYDTAYYLFKRPEMLYRSGTMLEAHGLKSAATPVYKRYLALPRDRQDTAVARYLKSRLVENR